MGINGLMGKMILAGRLKLMTGLHIGGSSEFSAIGAVDNIVVRDPLSRQPYIPGSSLKGKMRYLLARVYARNGVLCDIKDENVILKRLFGSSGDPIILSRTQFFDIFMTPDSVDRISEMGTDLYLSEIKFENTISRMTGEANPRQIERVPAGAEFDLKLVYNIEKEEDIVEDMNHIGYGLMLLENDYLGGHGSRGYGRVKLAEESFKLEIMEYGAEKGARLPEKLREEAKEAFLSGIKGVLYNE